MKAVELGGGNNPEIHPNVDCRMTNNVDIVADLEKPLPLPSNEYDYVLSKFAIEHLSWRKVKGFIGEIYRILKAGGKVVVVTANLKEQARVIAEKPIWDGTESTLIFGDQDYIDNCHKCGFSPEYLVRLFKEAGFSNITVFPLPFCSTDQVLQAVK